MPRPPTPVSKVFACTLTAFALAGAISHATAIAEPAKIAKPAAVAKAASAQETKSTAAFAAFLEALWPDAKAAGVSRQTFDAAFAGVQLDSGVLERTKKQA